LAKLTLLNLMLTLMSLLQEGTEHHLRSILHLFGVFSTIGMHEPPGVAAFLCCEGLTHCQGASQWRRNARTSASSYPGGTFEAMTAKHTSTTSSAPQMGRSMVRSET
jgi:hypothetical protein